jgi:hypothetical protein
MKLVGLFLFIYLAAVLPTLAGPDIRQERVHFEAGASGTTIQGHIAGRKDFDYLLGAKAGQRLTVELHADNPQTYFNVLPPGSEDAIFVGSVSGNRFEGTLPASGDYRVRVYLMRAAARRDEQTHFSLKVQIGAGHAGESHTQTHDFADGLAGGPDFWEVTGVPAGDTLNLRSGPSTHDAVVGEIGNGSVIRNLGCKMVSGQRWCRVVRPENPSSKGWVAGRYLRESSYQQDHSSSGAVGLQDLVGARGSSGESELNSRGYTYRSGSKGGGSSYTNWRMGSPLS